MYILDQDLLMTLTVSVAKCEDESLKNALLPSLLCSIVSTGNVSLLTQILQFNADYIFESDYDDRTLLHIAAGAGHVEMVRNLIWHGLDVNKTDRFGQSVLRESVLTKNDEICSILRNHGALLNMDQEDSSSILSWAAYSNDINTIQRYLKNGINPFVKDYDGRTCLDIAKDSKYVGLVRVLEPYFETREGEEETETEFGNSFQQTQGEELKRTPERRTIDEVEEESTDYDAIQMCDNPFQANQV